MESIEISSMSKTTPTTPTNKTGHSSPWKKKKKFIKSNSYSSPTTPKQSSPKLSSSSQLSSSPTNTPYYNTPASPGSKLKLFFFSKINSSPTKHHHHHSNNNSNNNSNSSSPIEGISTTSSTNQSPVISSPFGFAHITHVNFDSSNQELTGLPRDWGKTLKRSVNKLVSVRRDSTAQRTLSNSSINNNDQQEHSQPPLQLQSMPDLSGNYGNNGSSTIFKEPPPPIKSFEYEIANKLRLSTPDDLALSINNTSTNGKNKNNNSNRPKSNSHSSTSSSSQLTTTTTTTISSSTTTTTTTTVPLSSSTLALTSSSPPKSNNNISSNLKTRKSSPTKLTSTSNGSQSASSLLSTTITTSSSSSLERSVSIIGGNNQISIKENNSKSMDSLIIGAPTLLRRDIHITWNHVSGQFEGVPPEWQPMLQPITSEKQKKKRMELRKRLIREESSKYDREERSRQLIRDRRERTRLLKIERRRSVYIARTSHDTITTPNQQPIVPPLPPPFKSYSLQNFRLWQISGSELFKTKRVEACFDSLCSNDVFVLDCGKVVYVWMGEGSSLQKQVKGASVANKIKYENDYIVEPIIIEFLMDTEKSIQHTEFFRNLTTTTVNNNNSTLTTPSTANPVTINNIFTNNLIINEKVTKIGISDDMVIQEQDSEVTWLYRVNDNGKINMIDDKPLVPTSLNSNTCFILDCETDIYVWHGKHSHPLKQKVAVIFAKEFLNIFSARPSWASLHIVHQGEEQWFFKERFLYWLEDECLVDNSKRNTTVRLNSLNLNCGGSGKASGGLQNNNNNNVNNIPTPIPIDSNFMVSDLFSIPDSYNSKPLSLSPSPSTASIISSSGSGFSVNNNSGNGNGSILGSSIGFDKKQHISLDIWKGEGDQWKKLTKDLHGHFESSKCYVCHHVYRLHGKFQSRAFFWQGSEASIRWWIVFQFGLYKELGEHMQMLDGPPPPTECLTQNKESHDFLKLFNNIFIHYTESSNSSLLSNSNSNSTFPPSSSTLSISSMSSFNSAISSSTNNINGGNNNINQTTTTSTTNLNSSNTTTTKQTLYQISLIANTFTRTIQFQEFDVSCLNSRDMFIFHSFTSKTIFVWHGKGCSKELKIISQNISNSILAYYQTTGEISKNEFDLVIDVLEGQEPPIFWKLFLSISNTAAQSITSMPLEQKRTFYAYDPYYERQLSNSNSNYHHSESTDSTPTTTVAPLTRINPKFYHLFYNVKIRTYVVTKISPFCQGDLCEEDSFILDCFYKVFVWFGPDCSQRKRETTRLLAKQYIEDSTIGHSIQDTKIVFVESGEEDPEFRSYFQGWSYTFTLTNWKNNSQSLIGSGADHRLLNSIVSYSSMSSQIDNIGGTESGDEGGYGFDTNSCTTTTTSTSVTPLSSSPMSSSPGFGSMGSFLLASVDNNNNGGNNQPLESWELELESTINSIKKKPLFSPKQSSYNGNGGRKSKKYDTIKQMLDDLSIDNSPRNSNDNILPPSITNEQSEFSLSSDDNENCNGSGISTYSSSTSSKPPTSPPLPISNKRNSQSSTTTSTTTNQPTSPNLSPVLKHRLIEIAHVNNAKHRKRGASETKKFSPLLKSISSINRPSATAINNSLATRNHGGSIDAKSMQELKLNKAELELDLEVGKIESELSAIVENIKDNNGGNSGNDHSNSIQSNSIQSTSSMPTIQEQSDNITITTFESPISPRTRSTHITPEPLLLSLPITPKQTPKPTLLPPILIPDISIPIKSEILQQPSNGVSSPSLNKKVALKVSVPIKPIEIQKISIVHSNATTTTSATPRLIQPSPRQPIVQPTPTPIPTPIPQPINNISLTTTPITPRIIQPSPRQRSPSPTQQPIIISPRPITSPRNTTPSFIPKNNSSLTKSNNSVPLTTSTSINNLSSYVNSTSASGTRPPPLQRTNSVKEKINQVETMVKNISDSVKMLSPKPVQRQESTVISFKSTINTSSNPIPQKLGSSGGNINNTSSSTTSCSTTLNTTESTLNNPRCVQTPKAFIR